MYEPGRCTTCVVYLTPLPYHATLLGRMIIHLLPVSLQTDLAKQQLAWDPPGPRSCGPLALERMDVIDPEESDVLSATDLNDDGLGGV